MAGIGAGRVTSLARMIATVVGIVILGVFFTAGPASAHNVLVSSNPSDGTVLDTAPEEVSFTFDQPIKDFDPALRVFGPGGNEFTSDGPTVLGNTISAPMDAGPAGEYRAVYRVVSADGHPVSGQITFTLSESAAGTATGTPTTDGEAGDDPAADDSEAAESGGLGVWLWVIVGAAVVLVVVALVITMRPRRGPHTD